MRRFSLVGVGSFSLEEKGGVSHRRLLRKVGLSTFALVKGNNKEKEDEEMENRMFCYQCQETAGNKGCTLKGVCGKDFTTANLMDLLIFNLKGIAIITTAARKAGVALDYRTADKTIMESLFATITNANFD